MSAVFVQRCSRFAGSGFRVHAALLSVLLSTVAPAAAAAGQTSVDPGTAEDADPAEDAAEDASEILVTARAFRDKASASSAKMDMALVDTPQAISVISRDALIAIGAVQTLDAIQYVPGVNFGGSFGLQPIVTSRGFQVSELFGYMLDGLNLGDDITLDPIVVERIEFVKGANSISFGQNSPGGFVNVVSRAPGSDLAGGFSVRGGSFGNVRVEGDVGGALNASGTIKGLVAASYETSDSFFDFGDEESKAVYGTLVTEITPRLTFTLKALYQESSQVVNAGIGGVVDPDVSDEPFLPKLPFSFFAGLPWADTRIETTYVQASAAYELSDNWTLSGYAAYSNNNIGYETAEPFGGNGEGGFIGPDGDTTVFPFFSRDRSGGRLGEVRLGGTFQLFGREQQALMFVDYKKRNFQSANIYIDETTTLNIFQPDYFAFANPFGADFERPPLERRTQLSTYGAAANVNLEVTDKLSFLLGLRYDDARSEVTSRIDGELADSSFEASRFTPRGAAVYSFAPKSNIYYSYSESFEPSNGFTCDGSTVAPEIARQHEAGVKSEFNDGALLLTAAVFDIRQRNSVVPDPVPGCAALGAVIPAGEFQSRGVELELVGNITPDWNVIGGYSFTDANYLGAGDLEVSPELVGQGAANVPRHKLTLFTAYDIASGPLAGLGFGGGYTYLGSRPADPANTLILPAANNFDAAVYFKGIPGVELSLNVRNITNERIYGSRFESPFGYITLDPPRTVLASIRTRY